MNNHVWKFPLALFVCALVYACGVTRDPQKDGAASTASCTSEVTANSIDRQKFVVAATPSQESMTLETTHSAGSNELEESITHAGATVLRISSHAPANGPRETSIDFGAGFLGVHEMTVEHGSVPRIAIDGRAVAPGNPMGQAPALRFVDGLPAPTLTAEPQMLDALQDIQVQAGALLPTCLAPGGSTSTSAGGAASGGADASVAAEGPSGHGPVKVEDIDILGGACKFTCGIAGDSCDCCGTCCDVGYTVCLQSAASTFAGCEVGTVGGGTPVCLPGLGLAVIACIDQQQSCANDCAGQECAGPVCSGGTPSPDSPGNHCSPGAVCCNGPINGSGNSGSCCDKQSDCCGGQCLEGVFAGDKCTDAAKGFACQSPGDICGPPDNAFCCPQATPTCRSGGSAQTLCCASNAGDICQGGTACCPSGSPKCMNNSLCCGTNDILCGPNSGCCPPPGTCAGGQCCNAPSTVCGSNCCASTDTCLSGGVCCGPGTMSSLCGSTCCSHLSQTCLGGTTCCTNANVCGSACCGQDQVCSDASTSTCITPGSSGQPTIELVNAAGNIVAYTGGPQGSATQSVSYTVNGSNFDAGSVTISLDSVGGTVVATSAASGANGAATFGTGSFTFPATGPHVLIGWQTIGGTTIQAQLSLNIEPLQ